MDLTFDKERELLARKKVELLKGVAVIDEALTALGPWMTNGTQPKASTPAVVRAGRRPMSQAAREAARRRMKKYWREKRKAAKG